MNVFKILICDIKEGILKNKRFIAAPLLALFVCMSAHTRIAFFYDSYEFGSKPTLFNLMLEAFRGSDPLSKIREMHAPIPYMWLSIFIFSMFTVLDYAYDDISNFGMQIISRTGKRASWWQSKCVWSVLSGIYYYGLFLLTVILFAALNDYSLSFNDNALISDLIANCSSYYTYKAAEVISGTELLLFILSPLIVICTLNIFQMTLSLFIRPLYSFFITLGILLLSAFTDGLFIFPRSAMLPFTSHYHQNAYSMKAGLIVCGAIILLSVAVGRIWFRRYDILPSKNEV